MQHRSPYRLLALTVCGVIAVALGVFFAIRAAKAPSQHGPSPDAGVTPSDDAVAVIAGDAQFGEWLTMWQAEDPFLSADEFVPATPAGGALVMPRPPEYATTPEPAHLVVPIAARYHWSPDRSRFVDVLASYGEPDSLLTVYNRDGARKLEALAFCGTPCTFDHAFWLNDDAVVVLGNAESLNDDGTPRCISTEEPMRCYRHLTVTRYDFAAGTYRAWRSGDHLFPADAYAERKADRWKASTAGPRISIESPLEQGVVGASFVVRGTAKTFEQNVRIRVTQVRTGETLVSGFTTARLGENDGPGPFAFDATLPTDDLESGDLLIIEAFEESAEDGSEIHLVERNVTYQE